MISFFGVFILVSCGLFAILMAAAIIRALFTSEQLAAIVFLLSISGLITTIIWVILKMLAKV